MSSASLFTKKKLIFQLLFPISRRKLTGHLHMMSSSSTDKKSAVKRARTNQETKNPVKVEQSASETRSIDTEDEMLERYILSLSVTILLYIEYNIL